MISQKQNKRDLYINEILKEFYYKERKVLAEKGYYGKPILIESVHTKFPIEDKIFINAALSKLFSNGYLKKVQTLFAGITPSGMMKFEKDYKPSGLIPVTSLVFPILKICYTSYENQEKIQNVDYFIIKLKEQEEIIIKENEHLYALHILYRNRYINLIESINNMHYQSITSKGVNYYLDHEPPDITEIIISSNIDKFLNLDYFPKERTQIKKLLFEWIAQFSEPDHKKVGVFLMDNLWIIPNQWCINKFNEFYEKELISIDIEEIYIFPAGGSGSSSEYWRHKFLRAVSGGKESSRTLKTLEKESSSDFWEKKIILIVDDIIGSGDQFFRFVEKFLLESNSLQDRFSNSRLIYFTPIATQFGSEELTKILPKIEFFHGKILRANEFLYN